MIFKNIVLCKVGKAVRNSTAKLMYICCYIRIIEIECTAVSSLGFLKGRGSHLHIKHSGGTQG